jgi:2-polyprenyl-3-methyl-5-hydroxy-6-metoxy-1,4-benzoquinol methylase
VFGLVILNRDTVSESRNGDDQMGQREGQRGAVQHSQDIAHGDNHDYTKGSPHLRHATLRKRIDSRIDGAIAEVLQREDRCAVLEIGAGHGSFTDTVLAAGGTATVTEMSRASFDYLAAKFRDTSEVKVVYDTDGNAPFKDGAHYDVILLISVIHHIPDYLEVITRLCDTVLRPGGTVVTFQDPVWYPRQTRWARATSSGSYFAWRITQGDFRRGLATRWRRLRGVYSESEPSDLVEYHVVRQGVDDRALCDILRARFTTVEFDSYFSTQSRQIQAIGEKHLPHNTFGVVAAGYGP